MKLLVIGGTMFLGRHLVDAARAAGHTVTLFNRGRTNPDLFDDVERIHGDRDGGLAALDGRTWDAAIDTCGYVPRVVRASAEYLAGRVRHYTFVSSISVYADLNQPGVDERAPVGTLDDPTVEQITGETYGPLKALCEAAAEEAMPDRVLVVRPGLIVGPFDPTDRFPYWVRRVAAGGEVLAPGSPARPIEFIDARDLGAWMLSMAERGATGVFNAAGPDRTVAMGAFLEACRTVAGSDASITWVDERFLLDAGVAPWTELPMWIPSGEDGSALMQADHSKAVAAGLTFRPLADTVRDTLAWLGAGPPYGRPSPALSREREAELLRDWHAREQR